MIFRIILATPCSDSNSKITFNSKKNKLWKKRKLISPNKSSCWTKESFQQTLWMKTKFFKKFWVDSTCCPNAFRELFNNVIQICNTLFSVVSSNMRNWLKEREVESAFSLRKLIWEFFWNVKTTRIFIIQPATRNVLQYIKKQVLFALKKNIWLDKFSN